MNGYEPHWTTAPCYYCKHGIKYYHEAVSVKPSGNNGTITTYTPAPRYHEECSEKANQPKVKIVANKDGSDSVYF